MNAVPLIIGNEIIGFLSVNGEQANYFDEQTTRRLEAFAANAALAMDIKATVVLQGNGVYMAHKGYAWRKNRERRCKGSGGGSGPRNTTRSSRPSSRDRWRWNKSHLPLSLSPGRNPRSPR